MSTSVMLGPETDPNCPPWLTERCTLRGWSGCGLGSSTQKWLLQTALDRTIASPAGSVPRGHPPGLDSICLGAARRESYDVGFTVALVDAFAEGWGGVGLVHTRTATHVEVEPVGCSRDFIKEHVVVGRYPGGSRHDVRDLLRGLAEAPAARRHVRNISFLARQAADALRCQDVKDLAFTVREYVDELQDWADRCLWTLRASAMVEALGTALRGKLLAAKPLGAGLCDSFLAVVGDGAAPAALGCLRAAGWVAQQAIVDEEGLTWEVRGDDGIATLRFSVPMRADIQAAADLGVADNLGEPGTCLAFAMGPRSELLANVRRGF